MNEYPSKFDDYCKFDELTNIYQFNHGNGCCLKITQMSPINRFRMCILISNVDVDR